jgi:hypothetical protein
MNDSSVIIVNRLWAVRQKNQGSIADGADFCQLHRVRTGCGAFTILATLSPWPKRLGRDVYH